MKEQKKSRKILLTVLFIAINIAVIAWTAISEFGNASEAAHFSEIQIRWIYLLPAALCWAGAMTIETLKYIIVMKRTCGYVDFGLCLGTVFLGRYYDNVTPSGVGGQPFQIYYMRKGGVPAAQSTSIPIIGFLAMQYGFILLALGTFILSGVHVANDVIRVSRYVGLVFYALFPTVIVCFTFLPKITGKVFAAFIRLGSKLHICKDPQKTIDSVYSGVEDYSKCVLQLVESFTLCVSTLILGTAYHIALCCIPYFVLRAFGGDMRFMECFVTTISIYAAITFIPTPGNAGAAESSFYLVFSMLTTGYTFWAMMTWRFFTYYIFILFGVGIYLRKYLASKRPKLNGDAIRD